MTSSFAHRYFFRQGRAGQEAGQGRAGQETRAGQGRAGQGRAGQGRAGQGRAGRAGQGRAGQGRAGQGRAGQGRAGQGPKSRTQTLSPHPPAPPILNPQPQNLFRFRVLASCRWHAA